MSTGTSRWEMHDAALALLRALGVEDVGRVRAFSLFVSADDVPHLVVTRFVGGELGDKTTLAGAAALAPHIQVTEREET